MVERASSGTNEESAREATAMRPDAVHAELRHAILDGELPPGAAVTEATVTLRCGVARPTARIAIDRLVAEGLLQRSAHRVARVPVLTADDVRDIFDTRRIVEVAAAESLARSGSIPAAALAAHRDFAAAVQAGAPTAEADIAFHRALVAGQTSPRLTRIHDAIMGEIELCIGQLQLHGLRVGAELLAEHSAILQALIEGDGARAAEVTAAHIAESRSRLLASFDAEGAVPAEELRASAPHPPAPHSPRSRKE